MEKRKAVVGPTAGRTGAGPLMVILRGHRLDG
jgi:hypothetical protein